MPGSAYRAGRDLAKRTPNTDPVCSRLARRRVVPFERTQKPGAIMTTETLITNVRPWGRETTNLRIVDGRVAETAPNLPAGDGVTVIEGDDGLLIPALVEAHVHFDKTLWGLPWHGHRAGPLLVDRINYEREYLGSADIDPEPQAAAVIRQAIAMGSVHIRSHADVTPELGLRRVEALAAIREQFGDRITLQIVAFPQLGVHAAPGTEELMDAAMAAGADVVGGIDPSAIDGNAEAHLDTVFALADRHAAGIDIHLHEIEAEGARSLELIAERTRAHGLQGRVVVSHGYCLGTVPADQVSRLIDLAATSGLAVLSAVPGHLPFPPLKQLHKAGVTVCLGSDSVRDCWLPFGNADMLERAFLAAYRSNFRADAEVELALEFATTGAAKAIGLERYGLDVGCRADFVLLPFETPAEAVAMRDPRRRVVSGGRLIARDGECLV